MSSEIYWVLEKSLSIYLKASPLPPAPLQATSNMFASYKSTGLQGYRLQGYRGYKATCCKTALEKRLLEDFLDSPREEVSGRFPGSSSR